MTREATNKLLEMIEDGLIDKDTVILACVNYMSEDEVADMCNDNGFFWEADWCEEEEDEEEEDMLTWTEEDINDYQ